VKSSPLDILKCVSFAVVKMYSKNFPLKKTIW